jgi:hypothetical protein
MSIDRSSKLAEWRTLGQSTLTASSFLVRAVIFAACTASQPSWWQTIAEEEITYGLQSQDAAKDRLKEPFKISVLSPDELATTITKNG